MKLSLLEVETDRLIIRPFQKADYESWLDGFNERLPSQYKYDDGYQVMASSTKEWFTEWIRGFDEAAHRDEMYVLGIFRKEDGANIGKLELIKILRMDYQWAMMGYSIHNQYWRNGYGVESVKAALPLFFSSLDFYRIELHIRVDNEPSILKEIPNASIHPICLETYDELAQMHGRHFSSAYAGTIEDPVTGTASGVMGAYYAEYLEKDFEHELGLIVEQGQEINKDGRVTVYVTKGIENEKLQIDIAGTAVYVKEFEISI